MKRHTSTLVIPDVQLPFHDPVVLKKIINVAATYQPDQVIQIGDLIDFPQVSRWNAQQAGMYVDTLQQHITQVKDELLSPLRQAAPKAAVRWVKGNHDERLHDFVSKYAHPLKSLDALSMESLFDLEKFGVSYESGPIRVATNTYALHGHECGGYSATLSAWDAKFQKRYGSEKSFIWGHTHQPGIIHRATGFKGKLSPRFSMNVGSIMNPTDAHYVKDGAMSWVHSFAWLEDDGKRAWPELVTLVDRLGYFKGERI